MTVPYWMQDAIFYQIFPDRFANGDTSNDPPNVQKWGAPPTVHGFQGGDLRGIIQRFDYLLDLGITALYLNPIFASASTHRYDTTDYYQIDPKLGTLNDFRALIDAAHRNNVRVVLDGVFNHCGRGFFAFSDLLENGDHSPYKDWFHVHGYPLDAYTTGDALSFEGWWKHKNMPKFNTRNKRVRKYIFDAARYWIDQGADGWRLDVPNEIDDDPFWAEFRNVVKSANSDAALIGEIWTLDPRWANDTHFDGLMNYPVRNALLALFKSEIKMGAFDKKIDEIIKTYPRENLYAMYVPIGSHDTERILFMLDKNLEKVKLSVLFQFAFPGAPAIYYGDEIGLDGDKDPDCRRAFAWDSANWRGDLHPWMRQIVGLRKKSNALRRGEFIPLMADDDHHAYAFARALGEEKIVAVFNFSAEAKTIKVPVKKLHERAGKSFRSLFDSKTYHVEEGHIAIKLAAWSGNWLEEG
jgi:glycosidase